MFDSDLQLYGLQNDASPTAPLEGRYLWRFNGAVGKSTTLQIPEQRVEIFYAYDFYLLAWLYFN